MSDEPSVASFQRSIEATFLERDRRRGLAGTFVWFVEEVGELARALHREGRAQLESEFIDVAAWLVSLASIRGVDLEKAAAKYADGCPRCRKTPCGCA